LLYITFFGETWFTLNVLSPRKKRLELEWKVLLLQHLIKKFMWKFDFKYETWKCVGRFSKFQYWCHEKEKAMLAIEWQNYSWFLQYMNNDNGDVCISNLFRLYVCTLNHFICFHFFVFQIIFHVITLIHCYMFFYAFIF